MRESDATLLCQRAPPTPNTSSVTTRASEIYTHTKRAARGGARWWQEAAVFALNAAATIAVNIIYVSYESSTHTSASSKVLIQVLMAGFKVVWNSVVVRQLCQLIHDRNIRSHVLMLIFNTLVAPCLASAVFDKSCFSDLIFGSDTMCTQYSYPSCLEAYQQYSSTMGQIETVCTHYINTAYVTEYTPSFIYSFACGSALLKAYIPVYIYSYTMLALLLPLFFFLLCATPLQHIPPCLLPHILGVMRPRQVADGVRFNQLLKAQSMQALYIQHLVVLLTFGVASPALAAVIALAVVVDSYALQGVLVRFVECASPNSVFCNADTDTDTDRDPSPHASPHARHAFGYAAPCGDWSAHSPSRPGEVAAGGAFEQARLGELEEACGDTWSSLRHTVWLVFYCCTTFYAALLFDVIGDNSGLQAALAVPVTALVVLLLVRLCAAPLLTELHEMHKSGKSNWFQIITRYTHNAQNWDWDIMCASLCCERKRGSGSRGSDKGSRGSSDLGEEASFLNADSDEAPPGTPGDSNGANSNSPLLYRSPHPPHSPHN
ncbi:hypothetical protein B484DRAFT_182595 [Ochromonadaceae sp. CCMP2298]|nr:hypothetical protein B484DRAFT_182595 [Ochromonadaceae sp. CCMP2298]